jgi:hypothetical protein
MAATAKAAGKSLGILLNGIGLTDTVMRIPEK